MFQFNEDLCWILLLKKILKSLINEFIFNYVDNRSMMVGTWWSFVNKFFCKHFEVKIHSIILKKVKLKAKFCETILEKILRAGAFMENKTNVFIRLRYQHRFSFKGTIVRKMSETTSTFYFARGCRFVHNSIYLITFTHTRFTRTCRYDHSK